MSNPGDLRSVAIPPHSPSGDETVVREVFVRLARIEQSLTDMRSQDRESLAEIRALTERVRTLELAESSRKASTGTYRYVVDTILMIGLALIGSGFWITKVV